MHRNFEKLSSENPGTIMPAKCLSPNIWKGFATRQPCSPNVSLSISFSPKHKGILLQNRKRVITAQKHISLCSPCSTFPFQGYPEHIMCSHVSGSTYHIISCFLVSFSLEQLLSFALTLMTFTFFENCKPIFEEHLSIWVCLIFPHMEVQVFRPLQEHQRSDTAF